MECSINFSEIVCQGEGRRGASRRKGAKDFQTLWGRSYDFFVVQGAVQTGKSQCEEGSAHQNSLTENDLRDRFLAFNFL